MGEYEGAEQVLCNIYVEGRLQSVAADLEAISVGLSTRIYEDVAPPGVTYPFIVWQCQSPPRDVRGVGLARVMVDTLYLVKAVMQGVSNAPLAPVVRAIDRAMTDAVGSAVGGGMVLTSVRSEQFSLHEVTEGTQYRHLGGTYRIQAQG